MRILIGGDVAPNKSNIDLFSSGNVKELMGESLFNTWIDTDMRLFNLETPLTDISNPIAKKGPNFINPLSAIEGIKNLRPSLVTLANNHILDQGVDGLYSTQNLLDNYSVPFVGTGSDLFQASRPYILNKNGVSIGVYACTEREFTIATEHTPGANPFDPLESLDHIETLKSRCDYVIVLYHGGKEHYRYPSPNLQKVCRKIVQKGADLVSCQHSHCIGAYEEFEGSTIVYGQGNFIFNTLNNEFWNTSLLIEVNINDKFNVKFIPIVRNEQGTQRANKQESENILSAFQWRSEEIQQEGFIEEKYHDFAQKHFYNYLRGLSGFGKWLSRIDRILLNGGLIKRKYKKKHLLSIQNYIECEAHRELLLQGLKNKNTKNKNL